ncbi:hypothetical protein L207DRAFT_516360 [Hyaloscypha variabilis F]|uniref:Uncharacterized protein n=1 Tax=Hyaloscypha variabilis (strain UAMH 11265 / GT02V1 / F) TaxID=1149755 RepID=A0A2J6RA82_HYAVF|nr:hypothetical protein L207DRAFT_516360 [Hyaloscypha variabilis F]
MRPVSNTPGVQYISRAASFHIETSSLFPLCHQRPLSEKDVSGASLAPWSLRARSRQIHQFNQPCRGVSASTVHGQSTCHPTPKLVTAGHPRPPARVPAPKHSPPLRTAQTPCPIRRLTAGQNSQPAPSPLDLLFVPSIYILGLLAPYTLVVTPSFNHPSVFRYRHFTTGQLSVVET